MEPGSIWHIRANCLGPSSGSTARPSSRALVLAWPPFSASSADTADGSGQGAPSIKEPHSTSHCREVRNLDLLAGIHYLDKGRWDKRMTIPLRILMIEDSKADALLLLRHLQRGGYEPVYERVDSAAAL